MSQVCNKDTYSDELKLEIINQLNRLNKSLKLTNCEELEKFKPETGDKSFDTIESLSRQKEIEQKKQELEAIKSPKTKSPEKSPEQLELERLKHESEVRKLKKDAFFDEQEMEQSRIKTEQSRIKTEQGFSLQSLSPQFPRKSAFPKREEMPHLENEFGNRIP